MIRFISYHILIVSIPILLVMIATGFIPVFDDFVEINQYQYSYLCSSPHMLRFAKEHGLFSDGKITVAEFQSIPPEAKLQIMELK